MRKKCFVLVVVVMSILLSFCPLVYAKESKIFPGEMVHGYRNIRFVGFIEKSATFRNENNDIVVFTIKKLPKQISVDLTYRWRKFWILEVNTDEDWILISDQKPKK